MLKLPGRDRSRGTPQDAENRGMKVELLYFDGCPSYEQLQPRLEQLVRDAGITQPIDLRRVGSDEAAQGERFLGSPTVRVDGRDVEPGAEQRNDFGLKCRLYRTDHDTSGVPPPEWITAALAGTTADRSNGDPPVDLEDLAAAIRAARPRFDQEEQRVALSLYRLLASGSPVTAAAVADRSGLPAGRVGELLDAWPEVFRDEGRVIAFGGLSLAGTKHAFDLDGHRLYTWCAWDTLFLPELLGRTAEVTSECPTTGNSIELTVTPARVDRVVPSDAALSMRAPTDCCADDDLIARFCRHVHFFASQQAAEQWLAERADDGFTLSIEQGFELGRIANRTNFAGSLD